MAQDKICKTVRQYNKGLISDEDMGRLLEIAEDYSRVKKQVYARYGGIGGLSKIYPGYTVQNEMTESGLRKELGMPSVYFYLAVFDALGDIKSQWTRAKTKVAELMGQNDSLTEEDKHYLRFLLKVSNAFEAVLSQKPMALSEEIQKQYDKLAQQVDADRLNRYLCRQMRKYHRKCGGQEAGQRKADGFSVAERAYRYGESGGQKGIFLSVKESRKRIFIPLTDGNRYKSQIYVRLFPEEGRLELNVPVYVAVRRLEGSGGRVGVSMGMHTMLTTDAGQGYGTELGKYQLEYADWVREQARSYGRNRENNPGRKKYHAKKKRLEEQLHSYINHELNRFFEEERPETVYAAKLPKPRSGGINKKINHSVTLWQRGYIRSRLMQKCKERSVEFAEVLGKDIGRECSVCGASGNKKDGIFVCGSCGMSMEEKTNTARNVLKRGTEGKVLH